MLEPAVFRSESLLYFPFYLQLNSALIEAKNIGYDIHVFETWRCPLRQDQLFKSKPRVTNAPAWMSWHQYGLAVDLAFGGPGKWSWVGPFGEVADLMQERGLVWGGAKDAGHFQYDHILPLAEARQIALKRGVPCVWATIENIKKGQKKEN